MLINTSLIINLSKPMAYFVN